MERKTISVAGMSCNGCEQNVENSLTMLDGVNRVEADHESERVEVVAENEVSEDDIADAIRNAGYELVA
jgi:copper chaperone